MMSFGPGVERELISIQDRSIQLLKVSGDQVITFPNIWENGSRFRHLGKRGRT